MQPPLTTLDLLIATAQRAENNNDWLAALAVWNDICANYPDASRGYSGAARVLRRLNRLDAVDKLLQEGLLRSPADSTILEEYALSAQQRNDWPEAHIRWSALRKQFPDSMMGYAGDGVALRCMHQFEAAEEIYRELFSRWPGFSSFDLLADYAELAQAKGVQAVASKLWADLRVRFPDMPRSYVRDAANLSAAGRLSEADALLAEAISRFPGETAALVEFAHLGERQQNSQEALKRWEAVLAAYPSIIDGYLGAAHVLIDLRRFADAENVIHPALQLFPDSRPLAEINARLALAMNNFSVAANRWELFRQRYPNSPAGYAGGVEALIELPDLSQAEELSETARALFPQDSHVFATWSYIAERREDWVEAERRWRLTSEQFPDVNYIQSGFTRALLQNRNWSAAESLITSALERHSTDIGLLRSHAECATEQSAWLVGEARWRKVMKLFPESPAGWCGLGDMWRRAGRFDQWSAVIKSGLELFPDDFDLEEQLAWNLTFRRDWPAALSLWVRLKQKRPNKPSVVSGTTQALLEVKQELAVSSADPLEKPFEIPLSLLDEQPGSNVENADLKTLLLRFESLGDSCEFGMVQRRCGAEPVGLLRWATTAPKQLITALKTRFAGVGEEEFTVVNILRGEFVTSDTRYEMYSHTFTPDTIEPLENFAKRHRRRMQYLRRKLIEDLEGGRKIFVYIYNKGLSVNEIHGIHEALRSYHKEAALLCVNVTTDTRRLGEVELISEELYLGFIDRYSTVNINHEMWVTICRKTYAMWKTKHELDTAAESPKVVQDAT